MIGSSMRAHNAGRFIAFLVATASAAVADGTAAQNVKELMGKAQTQSERRSVEELIRRLEDKSKTEAPASAPLPAAPAVAVPETRPEGPAAPVAPVVVAPIPPSPAPTQETAKPKPSTPTPAVATPKPPSPVVVPPPVMSLPKTPLAVPANAVEVAKQQKLPTVDIEVYFDFDSAEITDRAVNTLNVLGKALADPRLSTATFLIAGHTDSKGSPDYNRQLSEMRADAVRKYLIANFRIAESRLVSKGYGETQLKFPKRPHALANRRVQIINWTSQLAQ
ncbi:MAG: OmpA family protein [Hyphomicrobiaceae bacterium]